MDLYFKIIRNVKDMCRGGLDRFLVAQDKRLEADVPFLRRRKNPWRVR